MAEPFLEAFQDQDIDWLVKAGQQHTLEKDAVVIHQGAAVDALYIIINGQMISAVADDKESALGKAFSAITNDTHLAHELFSFQNGDVFGEIAVLNKPNSPMEVRAVGPTTVLMVPQSRLETKLAEDLEFASRFYWVMATLLLNRYELLLDKYVHRRGLQLSPIQDGPVIFGELFDSDVDWMVAHGSIRRLQPDDRLIQAGRPADMFYIVLQGLLSTAITAGKSSTLTQIFSQITADGPSDEPVGREVARSARGEVAGETTLLDSRLSKFAVSAVDPSMVLAIPHRELSSRLQQDPGMATRFYRMLTLLLSERLTSLIHCLRYGKSFYKSEPSLDANTTPKDELDLNLTDNLALGKVRFEWMLKRLKIESL
jgi:CRP-like cAMP-binding protein